jgi:YidC/Oxa1 family membrane protein insertase
MEAQRTYILIGLAIVTYLLFIAWQEDYAPRAPVQQTPTVNTDIVQDVPTTVPSDNTIPDQADLMPSMPSVQPEAKATSTLITVETDVLRLMIDPRGGDVVSGELLQFPLTQENPDIPVHILKQANGRVYTAMSGLIGEGMPDSASPRALYTAAQTTFKLADGVDELIVPLRWTNPDGLLIEKIYSLSRSSYEMDVSYRFTNTTTTTQTGTFFGQLKRDRVVEQINTGGGIGIQAYLGAAYSTQEKRYERYDFDDMDDANLNVSTQGGWVAFLQHYFISAWVPNQELTNQISTVTPNNLAIIRVVTPTVSAAPGEVFETGGVLYLGPKIQDDLEKIATGLDLTVDYGFLWWIGQPLFWILSWIQTIVGNWGLAII